MNKSITRRPFFLILCFAALLFSNTTGVFAAGDLSREQIDSFWNIEKIREMPLEVELLDKKEVNNGKIVLEELMFSSETTERGNYRIFAYYAYPKDAGNKHPGQLFIRGGLAPGRAEDAIEGASRGYATITIHQPNHYGGLSKTRRPSFPDWSESWNIFPVARHEKLSDWWLYHSCTALMRAITFLQSRSEVDRELIAVSGQSWGGFLAVMISGIDERIKVAVPVFGSGFTEGTYRNDWLEKMCPENRKDWLLYFDPGTYAKHIRCPVLYMTASNDWAYWLDSFVTTYLAMPSDKKRMSLYVNQSHVISPAMNNSKWQWMDLHCREIGVEFPAVGNEISFKANGDKLILRIAVDAVAPIDELVVAYSEGDNPVPPSRVWRTVNAARSDGGRWQAEIPVCFVDVPLHFFVSVRDRDGRFVSSVPDSVVPGRHGIERTLSSCERPGMIADKDDNFGNGRTFASVRTYAWVESPELGTASSRAICEYDPDENFGGLKVLKADCTAGKELEITREPHHFALKIHGKNDYVFCINMKSDRKGQLVRLGLYNKLSGKYFHESVKLTEEWESYRVELTVPENETAGLLAKIFIPSDDADSNVWMSGYSLEIK